VEDGHLKLKNPMIRPEPKAMPQTVVYHRDPWDGSMGSKVKWAKENITELQEPVTFPENTRAKENKATTPKPVTYPKDSRRRENKTDPQTVVYHRDSWDGSMGSKVKWAKENITELQKPVTFPENTRAKENKATTPEPVTYPKDSRRRENKTDLPKPVTYPPTKRALVAEALKKK